MDSLLTRLADELLIHDITEPSAVLGSLSDDDLQTTYDHILEQFALALLIGAHENSSWSDGKLVIAANRGDIHLLQTAFYAVTLEVRRRGFIGIERLLQADDTLNLKSEAATRLMPPTPIRRSLE